MFRRVPILQYYLNKKEDMLLSVSQSWNTIQE